MGKNDADRTCGLRADTRGIDEIDLMEEASTGRLKAPTDGANACVNAAKFDQLGSRIRNGPVDFSPPPPFTPRSPFSTSRGRAHGRHVQLEWPLTSRSNASAHRAERGQGGGEWEGRDPVLWAGEIPPSKRGYGRRNCAMKRSDFDSWQRWETLYRGGADAGQDGHAGRGRTHACLIAA